MARTRSAHWVGAAARSVALVCAGVVAMAGAAGCMPGQLARSSVFTEIHPSVRWVYKTGTQTGLILGAPAAIRTRPADMYTDGGCVIFKEVGPGGDTTTAQEPTVALSLASGRPMPDYKPAATVGRYAHSVWGGRYKRSVDLAGGLRAFIPSGGEDLYIGRRDWPDEKYVLLARGQDLDSGADAIWVDADTLILGFAGGWVMCVDVTRIPELKTARAGNATSRGGMSD